MAFGTDIHMEKADAGRIRGEQERIAMSCWFTSKGDTSLQLLKYQDEEGQIHTVRSIRVLCREEKHYNGIPTLEYVCRIEEGGYETEIKLIFFLEEHRWAMIKNSPSAGYQPAEGEFSTKDQEIWR